MSEENKEVVAEETTTQPIETTSVEQQNPQEFLENFNWHKYEQGIEAVDEAKLKEF